MHLNKGIIVTKGNINTLPAQMAITEQAGEITQITKDIIQEVEMCTPKHPYRFDQNALSEPSVYRLKRFEKIDLEEKNIVKLPLHQSKIIVLSDWMNDVHVKQVDSILRPGHATLNSNNCNSEFILTNSKNSPSKIFYFIWLVCINFVNSLPTCKTYNKY